MSSSRPGRPAIPCRPAVLILLAALVAPAHASAHGSTPTVGTDYRARVTRVLPPSAALGVRVLDADRKLRLRPARGSTVVVMGYTSEPFLRLDPAGVFVNEHSSTAFGLRLTDRAPVIFDPGAAPSWRRVASGTGYTWHDDRLLRGRPSRRWSVPIRIDGRPGSVAGVVDFRPAPPLWPWLAPVVLLLAGAITVAGLRRAALARAIGVDLAAVAAVGAVVALLGKMTYQESPTRGVLTAAIGALVGLAALIALGLASGRARLWIALGVGGVSAYVGLVLVGVFRHGFVLSALPASLTRAGVALALAAGGGSVVVLLAEAGWERSRPTRASRRRPAGAR